MIFRDAETLTRCVQNKTIVNFVQMLEGRETHVSENVMPRESWITSLEEGYYGPIIFCTSHAEISVIKAMIKFER